MINQNRVLSGSNGNVWMNGKLLAQVKKIEAKINGEFEEVKTVGNYATQNVYVGWSGDGTLVMQKIDSTVLNLMKDAYKTGEMPEIKIISQLKDKSTGKSERAAISNVVVTEFMLMNIEAKSLIDEELPLKFSDYEVLETI